MSADKKAKKIQEDDSQAGLEALESMVSRVTEALVNLRAENAALKARLAELEKSAKAAAKAAEKGEGEGWVEERNEFRTRVAKLTERLEGLLETARGEDDEEEDEAE